MTNRTVRVILPVLKKWTEPKHDSLTYRMTKVLTGHGYHHCNADLDSPEHTVQRCLAWRMQRGQQ